jgi:hypothetical protein
VLRFEDVYPNHPKGGFLYLASPFRGYLPNLYKPYEISREAQGALWKMNVNVFSPIACFYPTAQWEEVDLIDHEWWMNHDRPYMQAARGCIVLKVDGWDTSEGIAEEIAFFEKRNSNIYSLEWPLAFE